MDLNQNTANPNNSAPPAGRYNGFAIASLVFGILSLILCCTGILGIPCGALGILFGVLSGRRQLPKDKMAVLGTWLAAAGMILGVLMLGYSLYALFTDPQVQAQADFLLQQMYGVTLEDYLNLFLGR